MIYLEVQTPMVKKATAIIGAVCASIAIISSTATFASEANCHENSVFVIGAAEDNVISPDFSISEYITYYKNNGLGIPVCAYNHCNLEVSESTVMELRNIMEYPNVDISVKMNSENADIETERWDNGGIVYDFYNFDIVDCPKEMENANIVKIFEYQSCSYMILVKDEKFCIAKIK